jgi:type II secretory pathway pseudopilin PulG
MDWANIVNIVIGILVLVALPLAFRRRKKAAPLKREEFYQHLREMEIDVALSERGSDEEKIGLGHASGQRSEGIIAVRDGTIDWVNVVSVTSQYGVRYFLDYLVKATNVVGERKLKKTRLTKKKSPPLWGKVVAIDWKGDESLAQSLNLDYALEDKLLRARASGFKGNIWILPKPKYGYARIRTDYFLPSAEMFEALNSIARYIKSW